MPEEFYDDKKFNFS